MAIPSWAKQHLAEQQAARVRQSKRNQRPTSAHAVTRAIDRSAQRLARTFDGAVVDLSADDQESIAIWLSSDNVKLEDIPF